MIDEQDDIAELWWLLVFGFGMLLMGVHKLFKKLFR
jgi:hypothetical protein